MQKIAPIQGSALLLNKDTSKREHKRKRAFICVPGCESCVHIFPPGTQFEMVFNKEINNV